MTPKIPLFARIRTHAAKNARYFVGYQPDTGYYAVIRFDSWLEAWLFWRRKKRDPNCQKVRRWKA